MISHESHPLAGSNIEERRQRLERSAAKKRAANREALIPDMEPQRHEPAEWFAEVGYHAILKEIGETQPDYDWSSTLDRRGQVAEERGTPFQRDPQRRDQCGNSAT